HTSLPVIVGGYTTADRPGQAWWRRSGPQARVWCWSGSRSGAHFDESTLNVTGESALAQVLVRGPLAARSYVLAPRVGQCTASTRPRAGGPSERREGRCAAGGAREPALGPFPVRV